MRVLSKRSGRLITGREGLRRLLCRLRHGHAWPDRRLLGPLSSIGVEDVLRNQEAERHAAYELASQLLLEVNGVVRPDEERVEDPMDAQIHATAPILLDHLPEAVREAPAVTGSHRALV